MYADNPRLRFVVLNPRAVSRSMLLVAVTLLSALLVSAEFKPVSAQLGLVDSSYVSHQPR